MRRSAYYSLLLAGILAIPAAIYSQGLDTDVRNPPEEGFASVFFSDPNGGLRGAPLRTGDFDGDGFTDSLCTPFFASQLNSQGGVFRSVNGKVEVIFGNGTIGGTIDDKTYAGRTLQVNGASELSQLGIEVFAYDVDQDGYTDIIVGACHGKYHKDPGARGAGEVVILFGSPEWGDNVRVLDLNSLPGFQRALYIVGQRTMDRLGPWLNAGDLDQDGFVDVVMGMDQSDGLTGTNTNCGAAVIWWGQETIPTKLRVGEAASENMFTVIYGRDSIDQLGSTLWIDDWDGDGKLDLTVGAGVNRAGLAPTGDLNYTANGGGDGPQNNRFNAGEVEIFWEAGNLRQYRTIDLASPPPELTNRTTIYGEVNGGFFGEEIITGDLDGDGIKDLLVGALGADSFRGRGYVFWGGESFRAHSAIDVLNSSPGVFLRLRGSQPSAITTDTLNSLDVNADGIDDLFCASPYHSTPSGRNQNGLVQLIYGSPNLRSIGPTLDMAEVESSGPPAGILWNRLYAADNNDFFAYSASEGDMNGDGVMDYLPNCMTGDGYLNQYPEAAEYYILDGMEISRRASAPIDFVIQSAAGKGTDSILDWTDSQPVFGPVQFYQIDMMIADSNEREIIQTSGPVSILEYDSTVHTPLFARAIMERNGKAERSVWSRIGSHEQPPRPSPPAVGDVIAAILGLADPVVALDKNTDEGIDAGDVVPIY